MSVGRKSNTKARLKDKQQTRKTKSKIYTQTALNVSKIWGGSYRVTKKSITFQFLKGRKR